MMILDILFYILIILSIIFSFLLYKKLIPWNNQYTKYLKSLEIGNKNYNANRETVHSLVNKKAPRFEAISKKSNKEITLDSIIQDDLVLIFMSASCIYCDNNLELFLNESQKYPSFKYAVVMSENELAEATSLSLLFEKEIEVLIVKEQILIDYQIEFWPSFVHLNKSYIIQNITPVPTFAFHVNKTA